MNYEYYERKINDIILKCPIEAGVEILVYNLVDSTINSDQISVIDVNRLRKNRDKRLTTDGGVPDIAVLSVDFEFKSDKDKGQVFGFIEIKATNILLNETNQIECEKEKTRNFIYTNGLIWKYYRDGILEMDINLTSTDIQSVIKATKIKIDKNKFNELMNRLEKINWME